MANYKNSTATVQVKASAGHLYGIHVSTTSSGTLTIYDSASSSTSDPAITGTITVSAGTTYINIPQGVWFNNGLYVVLANTANFTVFYD